MTNIFLASRDVCKAIVQVHNSGICIISNLVAMRTHKVCALDEPAAFRNAASGIVSDCRPVTLPVREQIAWLAHHELARYGTRCNGVWPLHPSPLGVRAFLDIVRVCAVRLWPVDREIESQSLVRPCHMHAMCEGGGDSHEAVSR